MANSAEYWLWKDMPSSEVIHMTATLKNKQKKAHKNLWNSNASCLIYKRKEEEETCKHPVLNMQYNWNQEIDYTI